MKRRFNTKRLKIVTDMPDFNFILAKVAHDHGVGAIPQADVRH